MPRILLCGRNRRLPLRLFVDLRKRLLDCLLIGFVGKQLLPQVRAVLMISSLTGFLSGLPVIARTAGKADYVALVIAALARQIDSLGRDDQHCAAT